MFRGRNKVPCLMERFEKRQMLVRRTRLSLNRLTPSQFMLHVTPLARNHADIHPD